MPLGLEDCSNEIIEGVVVLLSLSDICNLRLTSRALATKATQSHFRSHFRTKHVDITDNDLQAFVAATKGHGLGCLVQHLVLVGVVNNTKLHEYTLWEEGPHEGDIDDGNMYRNEVERGHEDETAEEKAHRQKRDKIRKDLETLQERQAEYKQLHESGTDISLLSEAFNNIVIGKMSNRLPSLSLEVVVYREDATQRLSPLAGGSWKYIWQSAADTFHTALCSLAKSDLVVEKLNIFNARNLQRCSLAYNELNSFDSEHNKLDRSLGSLKTLSISFSGYYLKRDKEPSGDPATFSDWDEPEPRMEAWGIIEANPADNMNFTGFATLLKLSTQLEELEMHQYSVSYRPNAWYLERLLEYTTTMDILRNLKRLELRGFYVKEQHLLALIKRTGVRRLSMYNIHITSGTARSIFDYCTSDAANMEELYFHELSEQGIRVYFGVDGEVVTLCRGGMGTKQEIIYRSERIFRQGSPEQIESMRRMWREYGPPREGAA